LTQIPELVGDARPDDAVGYIMLMERSKGEAMREKGYLWWFAGGGESRHVRNIVVEGKVTNSIYHYATYSRRGESLPTV